MIWLNKLMQSLRANNLVPRRSVGSILKSFNKMIDELHTIANENQVKVSDNDMQISELRQANVQLSREITHALAVADKLDSLVKAN